MGRPEPTTPVVSMSPTSGHDDVHGAALALARSLGLAQHLGQQGPQGDALGDLVVESPVGGDEIVVGPSAAAQPAATASWPRGE